MKNKKLNALTQHHFNIIKNTQRYRDGLNISTTKAFKRKTESKHQQDVYNALYEYIEGFENACNIIYNLDLKSKILRPVSHKVGFIQDLEALEDHATILLCESYTIENLALKFSCILDGDGLHKINDEG